MAYNPYLHGFEPINYTPNNMFGVMNTNAANNLNTQVVDLSKGQMKVLDNPAIKYNIQENKDYDSILNDAGFRAQDIEGKPPTKQNIIDYYQGTYKPSASLNTLSNNRYVDAGTVMNDASLFSHANAAPINNTELEKGMTFGNRYSADELEFEGGVPRGLNTDDISYNTERIIANKEFEEQPGIHFKDKPIENIFNRRNHPRKGWFDENFRYRDLNKPDIQAMEPSEGGINYDKRGFSLSGILQGLKNQFKKNPEKQKEFDSWEENKDQTGWGYIGDTGLRGNIYEGPGGKKFSLVDPTTGYNVLQNKNWRGGTGRSLQEQINAKNAWIADRLFKGKGLSGKARAYAKLNKLGTYGDQENPFAPPSSGPGTKAVYEEHGWTQPTYHDDAFTSPRDSESAFGGDFSGAGPSRHARGGRVGYNEGGRVGILSVF